MWFRNGSARSASEQHWATRVPDPTTFQRDSTRLVLTPLCCWFVGEKNRCAPGVSGSGGDSFELYAPTFRKSPYRYQPSLMTEEGCPPKLASNSGERRWAAKELAKSYGWQAIASSRHQSGEGCPPKHAARRWTDAVIQPPLSEPDLASPQSSRLAFRSRAARHLLVPRSCRNASCMCSGTTRLLRSTTRASPRMWRHDMPSTIQAVALTRPSTVRGQLML